MKKLSKRHIFYIILTVIIMIACIWAFIAASIITKNFKKNIKTENYTTQTVEIEGLLLTETKEGKKLWEIYADKGFYDSKKQIVILTNVYANFWKDNQVSASAYSDQGAYNTKTKQINMFSNSKIVYKDGTYIIAEFMEWKGREKDVIAKKNVKIEKPNEFVIFSDKAVLKNNMTLFQVSGKVKTKVYTEGKFKI